MNEQDKIIQLQISEILDQLTNGHIHPITAKRNLYSLITSNACPKCASNNVVWTCYCNECKEAL